MKRRSVLLGGAAAAGLPSAAGAQKPAIPVIGFLSLLPESSLREQLAAFRAGLEEAGFVDGRTVAIEYRWADGDSGKLPRLAAELVGLRPALIVAAGGNISASAAKAATATIPVVFTAVRDPVQDGLVASLNRPGGNLTGVAILAEELEAAFSTLAAQKATGLVVASDPWLTSQRQRIVDLAARHRLPGIYQWRQFVDAGGLASYGPSFAEAYRLSGTLAGRVLRGESPATMPVMQPTKFEPVVNLRTARALGLAVPPSILIRAEEVVE